MDKSFKHFERPTTAKPGTIVSSAIVSAAVGLATGAAGFTIMKNLYPESPVSYNTVLPVASEDVTDSASVISKHLASVYTPSQRTGVYSQLYSEDQFLGTGAIVTSDGWVMLSPEVSLRQGQALTVFISGQQYTSTELKQDARLGVWFLKVDAVNLQPVQFAHNLPLGSTLVYSDALVGNQPILASVQLAQTDYLDIQTLLTQAQSADTYSVVDTLKSDLDRSPVLFTLDGKVAGVYVSGGSITADALDSALAHLLSGKDYPIYGFSYIERSRLTPAQEGALVTHPSRNPIVSGSVAADAGLQAEDVILEVNGSRITKDNTLASTLLQFSEGDIVSFKVLRGEEELTLELSL